MFSLIEKIKNKWRYNEKTKMRQLFLEKRKVKYPDCKLADSCKITDSDLGIHVVLHRKVNIKNSVLGDHVYISSGSELNYVSMGKYCSVAHNVNVGLERHPTSEFVSSYPAFFSVNNLGCHESFVEKNVYCEDPKKTTIGHDVWIGQNVIIPGGVTLGTGCIIAAGSVVVKDVPPYAIVGGNPARIIRFRFSEKDIEFLLKTRWWDLPEDDIFKLAPVFNDIHKFRMRINDVVSGDK